MSTRERNPLIYDEAICLDDEIQAVSSTTESTSHNTAGGATEPSVPAGNKKAEIIPNSSTSSSSRSLLSTGHVISETSDFSTDLLQSIGRRLDKDLPVQGGIHRNRRGRRRARRPCAAARRAPSPSPAPNLKWRNGTAPPSDTPAFKCIDCKIWFSNPFQYHNHISSAAHKFFVDKGTRIPWCGICREVKPNQHDFNTHLTSKGHNRKLLDLGAAVRVQYTLPDTHH